MSDKKTVLTVQTDGMKSGSAMALQGLLNKGGKSSKSSRERSAKRGESDMQSVVIGSAPQSASSSRSGSLSRPKQVSNEGEQSAASSDLQNAAAASASQSTSSSRPSSLSRPKQVSSSDMQSVVVGPAPAPAASSRSGSSSRSKLASSSSSSKIAASVIGGSNSMSQKMSELGLLNGGRRRPSATSGQNQSDDAQPEHADSSADPNATNDADQSAAETSGDREQLADSPAPDSPAIDASTPSSGYSPAQSWLTQQLPQNVEGRIAYHQNMVVFATSTMPAQPWEMHLQDTGGQYPYGRRPGGKAPSLLGCSKLASMIGQPELLLSRGCCDPDAEPGRPQHAGLGYEKERLEYYHNASAYGQARLACAGWSEEMLEEICEV